MAFGRLVTDVMDHTEVVLDGRCGWTSSSLMTKIDLAPGQLMDKHHRMSAGASIHWSVGVAAHEVLVQARFVPTSGITQQMIFSEKLLGDASKSHQGSWICGNFTADAAGTLEIHLNNSCVRLPSPPTPAVLPPAALASDIVLLRWPGKASRPGE
jgi:hypothetical protein